MIRLFSIAVLSAFLVGCASLEPPNVYRLSQFTPVATPQTIELREDVIHAETFSAWGPADQENGLLAGKYVSAYENHLATLFYSEDRVYHQKIGDSKVYLLHGGIWVPKAAHEQPKIFLSLDRPGVPRHESLGDDAVPAAILVAVLEESISGPSNNEGLRTHTLNGPVADKLHALVREQLGSD